MSILETEHKGLNFFTRVREKLGFSHRRFGREVLAGLGAGSVIGLEKDGYKTRISWLLFAKEAAKMSDEEFVEALYDHIRSELPPTPSSPPRP